MVKKPAPADRMIEAAMTLAARRGWRGLTLTEIMAEAGVSMAEAYPQMASKSAVLDALMARVDRAVLAEPAEDAGVAPRDRLFDLLMRRFDALRPYRLGLAAVMRDLPGDPFHALCAARGLDRSMGWMLRAAGLDGGGLRRAALQKALAGAYLLAFRRFLADDSTDLAATMAALDGALRRLERWTPLLRPAPTPPPKDHAAPQHNP